MTRCRAMLVARAMAGIATHILREVRVAFDVTGCFRVTLPASLVNSGLLREHQQQQQVHACFRTSRLVMVLRLV
jgi:hypothetical protein